MLTVLICAVLWLFAACAGTSSTVAPTGEDVTLAAGDSGLNSLPAPREVSTGESVIDVQGTSRSFLLSTAIYFAPEGQGVSQLVPDFTLVFEPSSGSQLTHTFFPLFGPLDDQKVRLGQISLDLHWTGEAPSDGHGMYVGVPDYPNNSWVWRGPARSTADILDFSEQGLNGNPAEFAFDKIALVNYSDVEVNLRYIGVTTTHPDDITGDEQLYFLTDDGSSMGISVTTTGNLDATEPIIAGGPGIELANLHVLTTGDDPLLVFDRRAAGGDWEVWQVSPDGESAQMRYGGETDVRFSGATPEAGYEFTLVGGVTEGNAELARRMSGSLDLELVLEVPGTMNGGAFWYGNESSPNIALITSGLDEEGRPTVMYFGYSDWSQQTFFVPMVFVQDGEGAFDPFHHRWAGSSLTFSPTLTLYSFEQSGDDTNEIRASFTGLPADQNNKTYLASAEFSLRYPSISTDSRLLSVVACAPGETSGDLYVQSAFLHELDPSGAVAGNVTGTPAWYDPTPPVLATE